MTSPSEKKIPLQEKHIALGGKMVPFAGFLMPVRYSADKEEHFVVREKAGLFDVSHMGEFIVEGPNALDLIQWLSSNDASKLAEGQAQYAYLPNETGGIVDDLIVYRIHSEKYLLVVNAGNIKKDWDWINSQNKFGALLKDISNETCLFALQGPLATKILSKITDTDLGAIKFYHFQVGTVAGVPEVIISGTGYTGAGGFEIYVHKNNALKVFEAILAAGSPEGMLPVGLGARDTLRLEMGYCLYGNDIDDHTSPFEAGLGWVTKFTKDFVNAQTLQQEKEHGVTQKLSGFKMIDKGIPRAGYPILDSHGNAVGKVTSGSLSPVLNLGIGMGYISKELAIPGQEIFVEVRGKSLRAEIHKPPFI